MTKEECLAFRLPRYQEFPDMALYADQVLSVIHRSLAPFEENGQPLLTSNMVNNYVKQKIVKPPVNKKYDRVHLAYFVAVCLLKRFMSLSEMCDGMAFILKRYNVETSYNIFCDALERALHRAFEAPLSLPDTHDGGDEVKLIHAAAGTVAHLCYARSLIEKEQLKEG